VRLTHALACRAIKRRMPRGLRASYDPEDFVGDAIVELMSHRARFVEFGPDLLILIAKRRMIDAARSKAMRGIAVPLRHSSSLPSSSSPVPHPQKRPWPGSDRGHRPA
jgi:DNA-directed RNA polymerase specialized sigma24 family protein